MLGQGVSALCPEDFEHRESGSLGLNGAVLPFVRGALGNAEELGKFASGHSQTAS